MIKNTFGKNFEIKSLSHQILEYLTDLRSDLSSNYETLIYSINQIM